MMYNNFSLSFLSRFTFCKVKWQHFKGVVEMLHVSCSKFSQLFNSEKMKILQQLTKLPSTIQCLPFRTTLYITRDAQRANTAEALLNHYSSLNTTAVSLTCNKLPIEPQCLMSIVRPTRRRQQAAA